MFFIKIFYRHWEFFIYVKIINWVHALRIQFGLGEHEQQNKSTKESKRLQLQPDILEVIAAINET